MSRPLNEMKLSSGRTLLQSQDPGHHSTTLARGTGWTPGKGQEDNGEERYFAYQLSRESGSESSKNLSGVANTSGNRSMDNLSPHFGSTDDDDG